MIERLVICGVGLIGGSLSLALKATGYCQEIVGLGRDVEALQRAVDLQAIDRFTTDAALATQGADVILLAVPMRAMHTVLTALQPTLAPHTILTDAGSTKQSVIAAVEQVFGQGFTRFVPGHPIAGRELSGVEAALPDLYQNRRVILTPLPHTDAHATEQVSQLWQQAGAIVETMPPALHDQILAATSHLPHVLAFSLVDTLLSQAQSEDILRYAAGGFRDFTRIASSDPIMWRDICLTNSAAILAMIEAMQMNLQQFATLIREQDSNGLQQRMETAKRARDSYIVQYDAG